MKQPWVDRFKKMVLAVALIGACAGANATITNLGASNPGAPLPFNGFAPVGPFIDTFTFLLPVNAGSGYSVINFPLSISGVSFNTIFSSLALYSDPDGTPFNLDDALLTSNSTGGGSSLSLTWGPTSGGNMYLTVAGVTNGTAGGLYSGAISVSAIPEPATWVMMAAGAILVGFSRLRRTHG